MPGAARVGDMHVCPMVTVLVPHVGGPILPPGEPTVLIEGMPAARVGDMATCVGPPDTIIVGSATVFIRRYACGPNGGFNRSWRNYNAGQRDRHHRIVI